MATHQACSISHLPTRIEKNKLSPSMKQTCLIDKLIYSESVGSNCVGPHYFYAICFLDYFATIVVVPYGVSRVYPYASIKW